MRQTSLLVKQFESDILYDLQTTAKTEQKEGNNDDGSDPVEALLTAVEALTSRDSYIETYTITTIVKKCFFLHFLAKIEHCAVRKSVSKPKTVKDQSFIC